MHHNGVACLVIGNGLALLFGDDAAFAFRAKDNALGGFFKIAHTDGLAILARRHDSCLVDQIFQISAHKSGRGTGQHIKINIAGTGLSA
jgi:hypothetical protein